MNKVVIGERKGERRERAFVWRLVVKDIEFVVVGNGGQCGLVLTG